MNGARLGKGACGPLPTEPYVRFSRIRLSSQWFPHRDWQTLAWAADMVNSPCSDIGIQYLRQRY